MGYRLHVCKEYRVIHGDGCFNSNYDLITGLFDDYCDNVWQSESGDIMEIPFEDFSYFLTRLRLNNGKISQIYQITIPYVEEIIDTLQEMYDQADKRNQCIRLEWF